MIKTLLGTENNYVALALRVALAVVIFPHGAQADLKYPFRSSL